MPCDCVLTDPGWGSAQGNSLETGKGEREQAVNDYGSVFCKWKYTFTSSFVIRNRCDLKIECVIRGSAQQD